MVSKKSAGCCGGPLADPERVHIFCCTKGVSVKSLEQARPTSVQANGLGSRTRSRSGREP